MNSNCIADPNGIDIIKHHFFSKQIDVGIIGIHFFLSKVVSQFRFFGKGNFFKFNNYTFRKFI